MNIEVKRYMDALDCKMIGMNSNKKYDYLLSRFNKAFEVESEFTDKQLNVFTAIVKKLSEIEKEIKEK